MNTDFNESVIQLEPIDKQIYNEKNIVFFVGNDMDKSYQMTFYKADFVQYRRILEDEEIKNRVSLFLLMYISLEAFYKKMLVAMKESSGKKLTKADKKKLSVTATDVKRTLAYFDVTFDEELIERIFGSNDRNYRECSIKKLRDRLVHSVNDNVIRIIIERYEDIMADLNELSLVLK